MGLIGRPNNIEHCYMYLGLKSSLSSKVVLILSGLKRVILLYLDFQMMLQHSPLDKNYYTVYIIWIEVNILHKVMLKKDWWGNY